MKQLTCSTKSYIFKYIQRAYGTPTLSNARRLETSTLKLENTSGKLSFLLQCRDLCILPKSFLPSAGLDSSRRNQRILLKAGFALLRSQIREHRRTISAQNTEVDRAKNTLRNVLDEEELRVLLSHVSMIRHTYKATQRATVQKKVNALICKRTWVFNRSRNSTQHHLRVNLDKIVINLSQRTLNTVEKSVLAKGLNFVPTTKNLNHADIITSAEESLINVEPQKADEIRSSISNAIILTHYKPDNNLSPLEFKILRDLRSDNSIIVTRVDKGNVVVVLDRNTYINKTKQVLELPAYKAIDSDPTQEVRKKLANKLTALSEETGDRYALKLSKILRYSSNAKSPQLYCSPKIHKTGFPLRPIVSTIGTATSSLGKCMARILRPLVGHRTSRTTNSKELVEQLRSLEIGKNDILISYDVKDLFTSLPLPYTYDVILEALSHVSVHERTQLNPHHIVDLVKFSTTVGNYFQFQGDYYAQLQGAPMGSPLSPVIAEFFMESLEQRAFAGDSNIWHVKLFKRYVDDILAIVHSGKEEAFLEHLNSLFPGQIAFTMEREQKGRLPFLDILLIRKGRRLTTIVYRKVTNNDRYLNFMSNHPTSVKIGVLTGMVDRAYHLCDNQFLEKELRHIKKTLIWNNYPIKLVNNRVDRRLLQLRQGRKEPRPPCLTRVTVPYYQGFGKKLKKLSSIVGFRVCFTSSPNIGAMLRSDISKPPTTHRPGAVYTVRCTCGATYIGETGNLVSERFNDHLSALKRYRTAESRKRGQQVRARGRPQTRHPDKIMEEALRASAVVEHAVVCGKTDNELTVAHICHEPHFRKRKIKEAFYIRHNRSFNRDEGFLISKAWLPSCLLTNCFDISHRSKQHRRHPNRISESDGTMAPVIPLDSQTA